MELLKSEYSNTKGISKLDKVYINCKDVSYFTLIDFLYTSYTEQAIVLQVLYDYKKDIVLKFGILDYINKEYEINVQLASLPNFIKYYCKIECNDSIKNIINHKENISNYKICHYGDNPVSILVMNYYKLGSIYDYEWSKDNFYILKNLIKQVVFAVILAYEKIGFIHGDLHCGNVLIKAKRNDEIIYKDKVLIVDTFECVIMDFEKSKLNVINKYSDLFRGIIKLINSIIDNNKMKLNIIYDVSRLYKLKHIFNEKINFYDELDEIIDSIVYV